jgi:arginine N-succinyltransferase
LPAVFYVRGATAADLDGLLAVAKHLDSVNLPNDPARLAETIQRSERSFAGKLEPARRELLFVMCERGAERVVGSSMIFAQHGTRRSPHIFFDVIDEERYSETLDRHFHHKVLRIGYNYAGLTEIGGLVVLPELRGHRERLGRTLVLVRFVYIALHRALFRDEMVSELMPPLESDGTSLLWEALGRNFTELGYQEADRLSRENKEFIRTLFPQDPIYASLLPEAARALIGQVGPHSKGVEKILREIGFRFANRIDPFDGGPHFQARTDDVTAVRDTRRARVGEIGPGAPPGAAPHLVAAEPAAAPWYRAVRTPARLHGEDLALGEEAARVLGVATGDAIAVLPL